MSLDHGPGKTFQWVSLVCGAIVACAGAVLLAYWVVGRSLIAAAREHYIVMAPNTALVFAMLGGALVVYHSRFTSHLTRRSVISVALLCSILAILTLVDIFSGHALCVEPLIVRTSEMHGVVSKGHMSPVTACCFLLGGTVSSFHAVLAELLVVSVVGIGAMSSYYASGNRAPNDHIDERYVPTCDPNRCWSTRDLFNRQNEITGRLALSAKPIQGDRRPRLP